jgi:bacterioferritin-associated ferredoxin
LNRDGECKNGTRFSIFLTVSKYCQIRQKEIKIAAGTRISPAAADLIKEHQIHIVRLAPNEVREDKNDPPDRISSAPGDAGAKVPPSRQVESAWPSAEIKEEISEAELEAIVNRVLERFRQVKAEQAPDRADQAPAAVQTEEPAADNADDLIICRCEEITRGEIKAAIRNGMQTLNGIKRVTRAGMGLCQGQTCQRLVAQILSQELGIKPAEIDPTTARGPVRPLRLGVFANN